MEQPAGARRQELPELALTMGGQRPCPFKEGLIHLPHYQGSESTMASTSMEYIFTGSQNGHLGEFSWFLNMGIDVISVWFLWLA
jgi:hypothetical protein